VPSLLELALALPAADTTGYQNCKRCQSAAKWSTTLVVRHSTATETDLSPFRRLSAGIDGRRRVHVRAQVCPVVRAGVQQSEGSEIILEEGVDPPRHC